MRLGPALARNRSADTDGPGSSRGGRRDLPLIEEQFGLASARKDEPRPIIDLTGDV